MRQSPCPVRWQWLASRESFECVFLIGFLERRVHPSQWVRVSQSIQTYFPGVGSNYVNFQVGWIWSRSYYLLRDLCCCSESFSLRLKFQRSCERSAQPLSPYFSRCKVPGPLRLTFRLWAIPNVFLLFFVFVRVSTVALVETLHLSFSVSILKHVHSRLICQYTCDLGLRYWEGSSSRVHGSSACLTVGTAWSRRSLTYLSRRHLVV